MDSPTDENGQKGTIIFSKYWLKYFLYGPLEWLWRSATYLKLQTFRKTEHSKHIERANAGKLEQPAFDSKQ